MQNYFFHNYVSKTMFFIKNHLIKKAYLVYILIFDLYIDIKAKDSIDENLRNIVTNVLFIAASISAIIGVITTYLDMKSVILFVLYTIYTHCFTY